MAKASPDLQQQEPCRQTAGQEDLLRQHGTTLEEQVSAQAAAKNLKLQADLNKSRQSESTHLGNCLVHYSPKSGSPYESWLGNALKVVADALGSNPASSVFGIKTVLKKKIAYDKTYQPVVDRLMNDNNITWQMFLTEMQRSFPVCTIEFAKAFDDLKQTDNDDESFLKAIQDCHDAYQIKVKFITFLSVLAMLCLALILFS